MEDAFVQHGAFSWCELMTTDVAAAKSFYTELLGWSITETPVADAPYHIISIGGREIGGIMAIPPRTAGAFPSWGAYVTVDDVDAIAQKAQELGARTIVPLTDIPDVGRFYKFQDPQGAVLSVLSYVKKSAE
jgi:predicted enzyme related to lactoylglutathione lyase